MGARTGAILVVCAALVGVSAACLHAQKEAGEPAVPRPMSKAEKAEKPDQAQPTRVQIELFELACPNQQLIKLDADRFSSEGGATTGRSPADVLKYLGELGKARLLIRIDKVTDLRKDTKLTRGTRMPVVQGVTTAKEGSVTPSVTYQQVGCTSGVSGQWRGEGPAQRADIHLRIEFSNVTGSGVSVGTGTELPAFQNFSFDSTLVLGSGRPVFVIGNDFPLAGMENDLSNVAVLRVVATRMPD